MLANWVPSLLASQWGYFIFISLFGDNGAEADRRRVYAVRVVPMVMPSACKPACNNDPPIACTLQAP
jgi:hypothetical protein